MGGGAGPHIYIPQGQDGPVISQALGSYFVTSYSLQGCDGGVLTRLQTWYNQLK
jgi:hypothetical protein